MSLSVFIDRNENVYPFKKTGLLENKKLIRKEVAIPETSHEDKDYSEYDSNLSENSVTTSDESEMTDLAGIFVELEIEAPEVVRAKKYLKTYISSRPRVYQI